MITEITPQMPINPETRSYFINHSLTDPTYHTPGDIEILLSVDILLSLLLDGKHFGQNGEPSALETVFGWVLMGPVEFHESPFVTSLCLTVFETLDHMLKQFWELEKITLICHLSLNDVIEEEFFKSTITRITSGRFVVRLSFHIPFPLFVDSKALAVRQKFRALKLRLN